MNKEDKAETDKATEPMEESALKADFETRLKQEREQKLMALADLDNYRKKVEIEKSELYKQATSSILREVADVIDDFERMVEDLEKPGVEDKIDAFKPVLDKLKGILVDNMLAVIEVNPGDKFNPEIMQALGTVNVETESEDNMVKHVAQKGYRFQGDNGRILRHTRVIVGKFESK
jgi:molecular chaperone GrpE